MARATKKKRSGHTTNVSVSLDARALEMLRERADETHGGNLSAAIAEAARALHREAARAYVAEELMSGRPPLTDQDRRRIDTELEEGWQLARRRAKKRTRAA